MKRIDKLFLLNTVHLQQGIDLLIGLTDEQYTAIHPPVYNSGIGEHVRHILEHYQLFLDGLEVGRIDYDARLRDTRISADRASAIQRTRLLMDALSSLSDATTDATIEVNMAAASTPDADAPLSDSTIKRELHYLQAHTIHHFALIAMIARLQGVEPPDAFGIAPSTLQYRQNVPS